MAGKPPALAGEPDSRIVRLFTAIDRSQCEQRERMSLRSTCTSNQTFGGGLKNLETRDLAECLFHGVSRSCPACPGQPIHQPQCGRVIGSGAQEG